ncbi:MAG TPA: hypothetical protein VFE84_07820 [Patescibacteria group bacterium]|nr:hypothetical protein [Patescibacteria group bacterium]
MKPYRCPDPSHGAAVVPLKANNARVYECPSLHKYWRREESGVALLVNLITQEGFPGVEIEESASAGPERPRLNFMVDVPCLTGGMDFNALSLAPAQWKLVARVDGTSTLEEVRLLAGLSPTDAERVVYELIDAGLIEIKRRGGIKS